MSLQPIRRLSVALLVAFVTTSTALLGLPVSAQAWAAGSYSSTSERQLVSLTNQARASAGLRSLRVDTVLLSVARSRSKDMIERNYFSHDIPPSGRDVFDLLDARGYCYTLAGENIGWNTYPDDQATSVIHQMFMNSSGHRANILGRRWEAIGIGAYKGSDGKHMWTVLFADKCGSVGTTTKPKSTPKPTLRPVIRSTPRPTPRPTPRRTPRPTVVATPVPTPSAEPLSTPPAPPPPLGSIPPADPADAPSPPDGAPAAAWVPSSQARFSSALLPGGVIPLDGLRGPPNGEPPAAAGGSQPGDATTSAGAGGPAPVSHSMRVRPAGPSQGFLESLIGGALGLAAGS